MDQTLSNMLQQLLENSTHIPSMELDYWRSLAIRLLGGLESLSEEERSSISTAYQNLRLSSSASPVPSPWVW